MDRPLERRIGLVTLTFRSLTSLRLPFVRTPSGFSRRMMSAAAVDHIEQAETGESYRLNMELNRLGMLAGPSSGLGLSGLLQHIARAKAENRLDALRNEDGEVCCVFVCCDGPLAYLDKYEKYVAPEHFPNVSNKDLPKDKPGYAAAKVFALGLTRGCCRRFVGVTSLYD